MVHLLGLAVADPEPPGLVVEAVGAGDQLPEGAGAREPGFQVELLGGGVVEGSGDDADDPVGDVEHLTEGLGVAHHLVQGLPGLVVVWRSYHKLLNLLKLVDSAIQ